MPIPVNLQDFLLAIAIVIITTLASVYFKIPVFIYDVPIFILGLLMYILGQKRTGTILMLAPCLAWLFSRMIKS